MYILVVSRGYPNQRYKMNGLFEFDQAKALVSQGHKVIFLSLDLRSIKRKRKWGFETKNIEGVIIEGINIPCGRIPKYLFHKVGTFGFRILFKKISKKYGIPDIVHSHFLTTGYMANEVIKDTELPHILTEHYSAMNKDVIAPHLLEIGKKTYPNVSKLITVSEALQKNIEKNFNVETKVLPNMYDDTIFTFKERNIPSSDYLFISVGSLTVNKNMASLIKAFNVAYKENSQIRLHIYGEGPEREELEKIINSYNLNSVISLKGSVSRIEIAEAFQNSNCFVLASKSETFGVAFIEALATGLPVIATKCGGPEEFVNKKNGMLISEGSVHELAEAIKEMYKSAETFNSHEISTNIKNKYSTKTITKQIALLYNNILMNSKS